MLTERCNKLEPISAREEARNEAPAVDIVAVARSKLPAIGSSIVFLHNKHVHWEEQKKRYQNNFFLHLNLMKQASKLKRRSKYNCRSQIKGPKHANNNQLTFWHTVYPRIVDLCQIARHPLKSAAALRSMFLAKIGIKFRQWCQSRPKLPMASYNGCSSNRQQTVQLCWTHSPLYGWM